MIIIRKTGVLLIILFCAIFQLNCNTDYLTPESQQIHQAFWTEGNPYFYRYMMKESAYQTPMFHFHSDQPGPAVLIIGGTHGNEPAGFEAAHRLLDFFSKTPLQQGDVFVIPEANRLAVLKNSRRIPVPASIDREKGNLNRCYPGAPDGLPMEQLAYEITQFIQEKGIDLLLDLHESPVFNLEYKADSSEYHGLGQTLIYTPTEEATWLGMVVLDHLNEKIPPGISQFSMMERPIKYSAAWAAGMNHNIPAFTTETCKKLPLEERIGYQIGIVMVMLKEKGML